ncbi:30S ribosomal protein S7 [Candidatus Peregrinibacteria bacterium]|jgi:small subunit ribosomal protein S7|nr:30S ribosomal protein S7 [Candidatus Peregrinibacteria bacterium]
MYTYLPAGSTDLIEKFVTSMMLDGKKHLARMILQNCLEELKSRGHKNPSDAFEAALRNIMPHVEVRPKRVGGAVYQIPMEVNSKRQVSLAIRWVLAASRKKKGIPMFKRLAAEIHDALNDQGEAFKKKEDVRRMAEANKAFAHLARY